MQKQKNLHSIATINVALNIKKQIMLLILKS